ncbi:hypothetical protein [Saccharicrinis sp. FJH54]|uniref:hypothetical protein n=1 Tax=Saccharicrinis sp. FJH54 TaxID=3344665 RepID=UPI0035D4E0A8
MRDITTKDTKELQRVRRKTNHCDLGAFLVNFGVKMEEVKFRTAKGTKEINKEVE